ncbi:MAG: hypothetical protein ACE5GO_09530, partial [Anaerolineales bacterium]
MRARKISAHRKCQPRTFLCCSSPRCISEYSLNSEKQLDPYEGHVRHPRSLTGGDPGDTKSALPLGDAA